jgi:hypothetical protein
MPDTVGDMRIPSDGCAVVDRAGWAVAVWHHIVGAVMPL